MIRLSIVKHKHLTSSHVKRGTAKVTNSCAVNHPRTTLKTWDYFKLEYSTAKQLIKFAPPNPLKSLKNHQFTANSTHNYPGRSIVVCIYQCIHSKYKIFFYMRLDLKVRGFAVIS